MILAAGWRGDNRWRCPNCRSKAAAAAAVYAFRLTEQPWLEAACHCRGCQRMTASAFSTTLVMPEGGFAVIAGEPVIGGMHGDVADHHHCDWCKSWVFTRPRAAMGFVNVRATLLDDPYWFAPVAGDADGREAAMGRDRRRAKLRALPRHGGIPGADRRLPDGAGDRLIRVLAFQFLGHERVRMVRRGAGAAVAARQNLEQMAVWILEVDAPAIVPSIDLVAL